MALRRVFIANRGEIALRVVRAAHALGIDTVLAVSAADRDSLAAREAGRTVVIGPAPAQKSYLDARLLVHAAIATRCDALHPGYGFLSERPELAELCEDHDIHFVGPTAETMRRIGGKISARELARSAGVPLTEGSGALPDVNQALDEAERIGYPVVTKASAGGGGRGMTVARDPQALRACFARAGAEAQAAFGDGTLFLEHYVEHARHVEVQVMGDGAGTVRHFGERDCSVQRRYQKMIEEAPAAALPDAVRAKLLASATQLLEQIAYRNAGTVEFLYDPERETFYFMEVNARIQVEHPVSECLCGVDLVQLQLRVAGGEALPAAPEGSVTHGHAIEARIIAEDPDRGFAPSPGRITRWQPPTGSGVRLDSAMHEGATVPPYYDSMIAKLIVSGSDRTETVMRLRSALAAFRIEGIATNLPLLRFIVAHPDFAANHLDTLWLERRVLPEFVHARSS